MENLFESIEPVSILKCGHPIHTNCMSEYMKSAINALYVQNQW